MHALEKLTDSRVKSFRFQKKSFVSLDMEWRMSPKAQRLHLLNRMITVWNLEYWFYAHEIFKSLFLGDKNYNM